MRILLTGAGGVGKTTLAEQLALKLDLPLIPEMGRSLCQRLGYGQIGDLPDQEGFKKAVLLEQIAREDNLENFVADRGALDCWVLWQRWNICQAMTYDTESVYESARLQSKKYTHIIYVPIMFQASADGFRWTEPDYLHQIDRLTRMTLYDFDLWSITYTVRSDILQARLIEVQDWLNASSSACAD